jgi:hypothetical protein
MSDTAELLDVVDAVIGALRRHQIHYFVTGSFASSVHGEFRATNDIDLVAQLEPSALPALCRELEGEFVTDLEQATVAVSEGSSFNLIHRTTYLKVDVFPCISDFDSSAMERAITLQIPGAAEPLRVSSLEDIVLAKLRWFRLGGESSEVQRRDIRQLVALNRDELDVAFLRRWAVTLGVEDLLNGVLAT